MPNLIYSVLQLTTGRLFDHFNPAVLHGSLDLSQPHYARRSMDAMQEASIFGVYPLPSTVWCWSEAPE